MRNTLAATLAFGLLASTAQAEIVASSAYMATSSVGVIIELHDELAQPDICNGRSGFPMALIGMSRGLADPVEKAGVGCWAPDGTGNIVINALNYPQGRPIKVERSISDFTKTEHFTDWNASPVAARPAPTGTPDAADGVANRVEHLQSGTMVAALYDITMPCALGKNARAGAVVGVYPSGKEVRVNGCWVAQGDEIVMSGIMLDRPDAGVLNYRYKAAEFAGVIPR